jgi:hypothetical protein
MRTKTLLLTAALCAAGIATSKAQVYSVNAVGYVNTPLVKGYNLISNPLDNKAANGNQIKNLFATLPGGSQIFKFNGTTFLLAEVNPITLEIEGAIATQNLEPGDGVFVFVPPDAPANTTLTFVGEVKTGNLSSAIPPGFSIKSSQVPQAGTATGDLKFPAADNDQIFRFNEGTQKYETFSFTSLLGWDPADPAIEVGEAFFVNNLGAAKNWTRTFNINQ